MKKSALCLAALAVFPLGAWAQTSAAGGDASNRTPDWNIGVGVIASDHAYAGAKARYTPFPLVVYEGQRFFVRGVTGGVHLFKAGGLALDAIVKPGFNAMDASDFGRRELARRGIDRRDLDDRKLSIDAGLALDWRGAAGQVRLQAGHDVAGNSRGNLFDLSYGYPIHVGRAVLQPFVGMTYLSGKVADYYYGIHADEARRGVPDYRPGSVALPEFGLNVTYRASRRWTLFAGARYRKLPDKVSDSPLIDGDNDSRLFLGVTYGF